MDNKTIGIVVLVAVILVAGLVLFSNQPVSLTNTPSNLVSQHQGVMGSCANSPTKEIVMVAQSTAGNYLADSKCMSLYVTSGDKKSESTCYDECAKIWMPFAYDGKDIKAMGATHELYKRLNLVKRKDGTYQYAYGTTPL